MRGAIVLGAGRTTCTRSQFVRRPESRREEAKASQEIYRFDHELLAERRAMQGNNGDQLNLAECGNASIPATSDLAVSADCELPTFPAFVNLDAFLKEELPKPPELVKRLLHQGSKSILGSGSKSYKTWLLIDLAISVASGSPWVGFETAEARVLYLNLELGRPWFQSRLINVLEKKGLDMNGDWTTRLDVCFRSSS